MGEDVVAGLGVECETIAVQLDAIDEATFARTTNCPPWDLKELVVHIWDTIRLPPRFVPSDDTPLNAVDYYRRVERETDEYRRRKVDRTRAVANRFLTGASVVAALRTTATDLTLAMGSRDLAQVVAVGAIGAMSHSEFLITRVVSVAIHGLDVAISLNRAQFTTSAALALATPVLERLVGRAHTDIGWTRQDLLARATGRQMITEADRARLGSCAELLPVIS